MLSEKKFTIRFFLIHLCLIIPMLLTSVFAVSMVADRMMKLERKTALRQLESVVSDLEEIYSNYYEESVLLSGMSQLRPQKMTGNVKDTYEGIELLKLKKYFDKNITNVFMDYGTEYIYSTSGLSKPGVFFENILFCREESILRGLSAMESRESVCTFLLGSDAEGYMMYHYPVRQMVEERSSVNFIVPLEHIIDMFQIMDTKQWYQMQAEDESVVSVGYDSEGKAYILSAEEGTRRIDTGNYLVVEEMVYSSNMKISLYYEKKSFSIDNGLYQMQLLNMVLIAVGAILSAGTSWVLSKRRMKEITHLESLVKGQTENSRSLNGAYNRLQSMIVTEQSEKKEFASQLRERTAYVIFHGLIKNYDGLNLAFRNLGFGGYPKCFFVGAISTQTRLEEPQLPQFLKECLFTHMIYDSRDIVLFLYELQSGDGNQVQRKKIAGDIRTCLHDQGVRTVRIGMSQVYNDSLRIDCAHSEAVSVLEHVLSGEIRDFCGCWENAVEDIHFFLPDASAMQKFSDALHEQDFEVARKWLQNVLHSCSLKECTHENKSYVRFVVLQCLIQYLSEENIVERKIFLKECLNIDVNDEKRFIQSITNIMEQCLTKKDTDSFSLMLSFIEENYCRSDLTYEEVAAAGGIGKTYVSKVFRSKLGMSYIEYLTAVRMDRACTLLRTTDYSITEIVQLVGYVKPSSFQRCFKEKFGISATAYRRRERKLTEE